MSVLVSIDCAAYNHENYIAQALDGFLMQEADFDYEILIHDDASTDRTAEIIRKYQRKYPDIIKPIYQTENQYSKGIHVDAYNRLRAQGKYIALCEGDDYWTDSRKLQRQVEYMEANPECTMCFHSVEMVNNDQTPTGRFIRPYRENRLVSVEDIIAGGGDFFGTCSVVFPKKCMDDPPEFYLQCPIGDAPLALNLAIQGTVYYMDEMMSAYRRGVEGSWSSQALGSKDKLIKHLIAMIQMRKSFNNYTNFIYTDSVELKIIKLEAALLIAEGNLKKLKSERYRKYYNQFGTSRIAKIYLNKYFPRISNKISFYKRNINTFMKKQLLMDR